MATPSEKLSQSLEILHKLQNKGGATIRARDLSRTHRERLLASGFLQEVIKGWFIPSHPSEVQGDSTTWYTSFWTFCSVYLKERFGQNWCLSPDQSLLIHSGNWVVPQQLLVRSPKARNKVTNLPHGTSIFEVRSSLPLKNDAEVKEKIHLFSIASALINCSPRLFASNPTDVRTALSMVRDSSDILTKLLDGGHTVVAGRLTGAFRNVGRIRIADDILKTMQAAGYDARENDPFTSKLPHILSSRETSPYVNRIKLMWHQMRSVVLDRFPKAPGLTKDIDAYIKHVQDVYVTDAYHSLSIEGYRVTPELIERVKSGTWNPDNDDKDKEQRNALAARGYWQAYQSVLNSLDKILHGQNPGAIADEDHRAWYRELFAPSITAGILKPSDLAGYRNSQVYIRRSMHVPLNREAVLDTMPAFFDLLREETETSVRVVLGHFIFVYIHPYMDGNGRIGRFLMNTMLASGGYPWTIIPVERRKVYMAALEKASVEQDISAFTDFIATLVEEGMSGKPLPKIPESSS